VKKALYLHGFLGGPGDMKPLFLEGYECTTYDLRRLLLEEDPVSFLANTTENYDVILGYSFGGRILEELQARFSHKAEQWVFVSSRHMPYTDKELEKREMFRSSLLDKLDDVPSFFQAWRELPLFLGHDMDTYRAQNDIPYIPWSAEQIEVYLQKFFNSIQFKPHFLKGSVYLHGDQDIKYTEEGLRLSDSFSVYACSGGHRFLFEDAEGFKVALRSILDSERNQ
jgi:surfactin synthase thioesterase subunit